jgi:hypothetical protein
VRSILMPGSLSSGVSTGGEAPRWIQRGEPGGCGCRGADHSAQYKGQVIVEKLPSSTRAVAMTEKPVAAEALSCGLSLGRTVARIQMPPVTPPVAPPVAPPVTPPIAGAQSLRKLTGKVRHGKKLRLPARTRQGAKIAWNAAPKKVCTVKGVVLKTKKKGHVPGQGCGAGRHRLRPVERRLPNPRQVGGRARRAEGDGGLRPAVRGQSTRISLHHGFGASQWWFA